MIRHKYPEEDKRGERYMLTSITTGKESPRTWATGGQHPLGLKSNMSLQSTVHQGWKQYLIAHGSKL
eukprot:4747601-Prorocentrum_lima.AAC.1